MRTTFRTLRTARRTVLAASALTAALTLTSACSAGSDDAGGSGGSSGSGGEKPSASAPAGDGGDSASPTRSAAGDASDGTSDAPAPTATGSPSDTDTDTTDTADAAAAGSRCAAADLGIGLGRTDHAAGNVYYDVRLTNDGDAACTLSGYPGVSLIQRDGSPIGTPATREGARGGTVTLAPGDDAHATLHTSNKGVDGPCRPAPDLLKVYPPGLRDALTLRTDDVLVCGDTFTTTALK